MPVAPRARPEDFFSPAQWQALNRRSRWRGLWLVAHCWGVIALAMLATARWPLLLPLAVMVVGTRQLGLFILMHDAAHGLLHPDRRINDAVGHWLCSSTLRDYRPYHLQHHRYVQQAEDPDLVLSAPFPISRASLRRKLWRDLSGQTFYKQRLQPALARWRGGAAAAATGSPLARNAQEVARDRRFWTANALGLAAFAAAGQAWAWWLLWALPMVCWLPMVTRIRNIAEHALVGANQPDPLRQARTTLAGWAERALLAPYWVNYHAEHHLFTSLPCWQLPRAHALLRAAGTTQRMEVQPGYRTVLRLATAG
jgi:fatty acid desaturase